MEIEQVITWNGMTQTHGFNVEVSRDAKTGMFVAQLHTYSPPLALQLVPGAPTPMMEFDDPEEIEHKDLNQLRELTKQQITSRCGKILQFFEK